MSQVVALHPPLQPGDVLVAARRQHVDIDRISFIDAARWLVGARDDASLPTLVVNPPRP